MTPLPTTCYECGREECSLLLHDEARGEAGPVTILCPVGHEFYVPEEASARTRIHKLREINREGAKRIDGYLVDIQTAGMLIALYDALKPESRERFGRIELGRLVDFGWQHVVPA